MVSDTATAFITLAIGTIAIAGTLQLWEFHMYRRDRKLQRHFDEAVSLASDDFE